MKKRFIIIVLLLAVFLLAGCTRNNGNDTESASPRATEDVSPTNSARPADGIGRIYTRDFAPEDVVTDETGRMEYIRNEILLVAKMGASFDDVKALIESFSGEIVGYIELTGDYQVAFTNKTESELNDLIEQFKASPLINDAMLNYVVHAAAEAASVSDTWGGDDWSEEIPEGKNWGIEAIRAREAWSHAVEMSNINIGIIDSGYQFDHEDLTNTIVWNRTGATGAHGTHVLGTFAAQTNNGIGVSGVFPNRINGETPAADVYTAVLSDASSMIRYKEILVDLIVRNVKVINISQGFNEWEAVVFAASVGEKSAIDYIKSLSEPIGDLLHRLLTMGYDFVICQAAGNNSSKNLLDAEVYVRDESQRFGWRYTEKWDWNGYFGKLEAKYSSVITAIDNHQDVADRIIVVGAVKNKGVSLGNKHKGYSVCSFSNWGDRVDVLAPGYSIYSSVPKNAYEGGTKWSGTSMATPHVSGTAAMVWAANPSLSGADVKQIIINTTSMQITDTFAGESIFPYDDTNCTNGLLDAAAAVEAAISARDSGEVPDFEEKKYGAVATRIIDDKTGEPVTDDNGEVTENAVLRAYPVINGAVMPACVSIAEADNNGEVYLVVEPGDYELQLDIVGYEHFSLKVTVKEKEVIKIDSLRVVRGGQNATKSTYLDDCRIIRRESYQGNEGDSFVDVIGSNTNSRGNKGVDGKTYTHGLEAWIARWNFSSEISWAYAIFELGSQYQSLSGSVVLIDSYNTENFDSTLYFYDGERLIESYRLSPQSIPFEFSIDISGVTQLKVLVEDNVAVSGGTSFGIVDAVLSTSG